MSRHKEAERLKRWHEKLVDKEQNSSGFKCQHCGEWVSSVPELMGTRHRNHCPYCLWSKHMDREKQGDRESSCRAGMRPLGLTLKKEGINIYSGRPKKGELMLVHECQRCGKISINRLAGDDISEIVLAMFKESLNLPKEVVLELAKDGIDLLIEKDMNLVISLLSVKDFIKLGKI